MEIAALLAGICIALYFRGRHLSKKQDHNRKIAATYNRFANEMLSIGDLDRANFWYEQATKKYYEN